MVEVVKIELEHGINMHAETEEVRRVLMPFGIDVELTGEVITAKVHDSRDAEELVADKLSEAGIGAYVYKS